MTADELRARAGFIQDNPNHYGGCVCCDTAHRVGKVLPAFIALLEAAEAYCNKCGEDTMSDEIIAKFNALRAAVRAIREVKG